MFTKNTNTKRYRNECRRSILLDCIVPRRQNLRAFAKGMRGRRRGKEKGMLLTRRGRRRRRSRRGGRQERASSWLIAFRSLSNRRKMSKERRSSCWRKDIEQRAKARRPSKARNKGRACVCDRPVATKAPKANEHVSGGPYSSGWGISFWYIFTDTNDRLRCLVGENDGETASYFPDFCVECQK